MKGSIDHSGQLTLEPESPLEAYAMHKWAQDNFVVTDKVDGQQSVWKGDSMVISANVQIVGSPFRGDPFREIPR